MPGLRLRARQATLLIEARPFGAVTRAPGHVAEQKGHAHAPLLLAQDNAAIGLALEDALNDGGYTVVGPFASCSAALAWLRDATPDLAFLLDLGLQDGPSVELARALRQRGVPILVLNADAQSECELDPELRDVPWIEKPVASESLMNALGALAPAA